MVVGTLNCSILMGTLKPRSGVRRDREQDRGQDREQVRHEARQGTSETSSKTGDKTGSETGGQDRFCTMDLCSFVDFVEFLVAR